MPPSNQLPVDAAFDVALEFERARSSGRWADAWALVAESARAHIGTMDEFAAEQGAYNAAGGSNYFFDSIIIEPSTVAPIIDAFRPVVEQEAAVEDGFVVFFLHPDVADLAERRTVLFAAPLRSSGEWRVWPAG